jgi:hypothetical protein
VFTRSPVGRPIYVAVRVSKIQRAAFFLHADDFHAGDHRRDRDRSPTVPRIAVGPNLGVDFARGSPVCRFAESVPDGRAAGWGNRALVGGINDQNVPRRRTAQFGRDGDHLAIKFNSIATIRESLPLEIRRRQRGLLRHW